MYSRTFADVSEYQQPPRMSRYAATGALLIAIKATEGTDWIDPRYVENVTHAHGAGLAVWHYHFAHPDSDPDAVGEAGHFWRTVEPHYHPGDRLVLDIELHHPEGAAGLCRYTAALDQHLIRISGIHAVAYTYDALLRETGPHWQVVSGDWWIANYGGRVRRLGAGRRMVAQQIADNARVPGILGPVDQSRLQLWYARQYAKRLHRR